MGWAGRVKRVGDSRGAAAGGKWGARSQARNPMRLVVSSNWQTPPRATKNRISAQHGPNEHLWHAPPTTSPSRAFSYSRPDYVDSSIADVSSLFNVWADAAAGVSRLSMWWLVLSLLPLAHSFTGQEYWEHLLDYCNKTDNGDFTKDPGVPASPSTVIPLLFSSPLLHRQRQAALLQGRGPQQEAHRPPLPPAHPPSPVQEGPRRSETLQSAASCKGKKALSGEGDCSRAWYRRIRASRCCWWTTGWQTARGCHIGSRSTSITCSTPSNGPCSPSTWARPRVFRY